MCGAECHLRQGSGHQDAAVPCEGRGGVFISKLSSPSNTSCWGSRKARPGGCVRCQLVEPQPLLLESGCGVVMAEKWGVKDLENKVISRELMLCSTRSSSSSNRGSYSVVIVVAAAVLLVVQ